MPRIPLHIPPDYPATIALWHGLETSDELIRFAASRGIDVSPLNEIHLEKRKREWLVTRLLMLELHLAPDLRFLSNGKPVLPDGRGISVSHCGNFGAVALAESAIGIDLQSPDAKLLRIHSRFCNQEEKQMISEETEMRLLQVTQIWAAKEAVFKYFGERVDFARDIRVLNIDEDLPYLTVDYSGEHGRRSFHVLKLKINDHFLLSAADTTPSDLF